jgi:hypothetical protein
MGEEGKKAPRSQWRHAGIRHDQYTVDAHAHQYRQ